MTKDEALDLALEALQEVYWSSRSAKHDEAITAIKQARALDKMAENARELGLDYEPVAPVQEDWGPGPHECHSLTAVPVQDIGVEQDERVFARIEARKNRDAAAVKEHSLNNVRCQCCGYMTYHREHMGCIRAAAAAPVQEPVAWRYRGIFHEFDPSDWAEGPVTPLYTTPPAAPVQEPVIDHSCKDTYELIMKWADIYAAQTGELYSQAAQDPSKVARMADERTMLACVVAQAISQPSAPTQKIEHITDGSPCWCNPETNYVDPETRIAVIVHKEPQ